METLFSFLYSQYLRRPFWTKMNFHNPSLIQALESYHFIILLCHRSKRKNGMYTASDKLQSHKHHVYANAVSKVLNSSFIARLIPKIETLLTKLLQAGGYFSFRYDCLKYNYVAEISFVLPILWKSTIQNFAWQPHREAGECHSCLSVVLPLFPSPLCAPQDPLQATSTGVTPDQPDQ